MISVQNLNFSYQKKPTLENINLEFHPGMNILVGPNGAGKSTLVKCLAGILEGKGQVSFFHHILPADILHFRHQQVGFLSQSGHVQTSLTVWEFVLLGLVHQLTLKVSEDQGAQAVGALRTLGLMSLAEKRIDQLSGGQFQMVCLAQVLVKEPRVLLLDEPLNNLDLHHQLAVLEFVRKITKEKNIISVVVLHDLNWAVRFADHLVVMHRGRVFRQGPGADILTPELMREVFEVKSAIYRPEPGKVLIDSWAEEGDLDECAAFYG